VALVAQTIMDVEIDGGRAYSPAPPWRWRLVDRLGEQVIRELIADGRAGATKRELVERYGISLSSVKRILKRTEVAHLDSSW
jgi:DNA invertase Pin-like site-specific DNA recombinase